MLYNWLGTLYRSDKSDKIEIIFKSGFATLGKTATDGMCYILILNPFPIVTDDVSPNVPFSTLRFYGKGTHQNYQCHYIPMATTDNNPNTIDYRPQVNGIDNALYDELDFKK
ncbi:unnamed protein product [Didymodactylos carnosus]|uniref:Uncharacterized protein n=1 Tax=Didymodactylos carnosus TaxID=1234261 RepID=A0A8S2FIP7_9BILA|nr:unnamed protein product [Didymodactylos carnosus]CAF4270032.1 unnamed protein product [Didymodactylos carnosus]